MVYIIIYLVSVGIYNFLPNRINYYFCALLTLCLILDFVLILCARFIVKTHLKYENNAEYAPYHEKIILIMNASWLPLGYIMGNLHYKNTFHHYEHDKPFQLPLTSKRQFIFIDIDFEYSGIYEFCLNNLVVYDFLGIFHFKISRGQTFEKIILPEKNDQYRICSIHTLTNKMSRQKQRTDSYQDDFEFVEYRQGMPLSKIHRKLSFKFNKPIVIQYNGYVHDELNIYLKLNEDKDLCENSLKIYSSYSSTLLKKKIPYYLHINDKMKYSIKNDTQWLYAMKQIFKSSKTGCEICYKHNADLLLQESANEIYKIESI